MWSQAACMGYIRNAYKNFGRKTYKNRLLERDLAADGRTYGP
jgi:hypothetical protein